MSYILHAFSYEREGRIGSLWLVCRADFLVCTPSASIRLAGLLRLDALEEKEGVQMVIEVVLVLFLVLLAGQ